MVTLTSTVTETACCRFRSQSSCIQMCPGTCLFCSFSVNCAWFYHRLSHIPPHNASGLSILATRKPKYKGSFQKSIVLWQKCCLFTFPWAELCHLNGLLSWSVWHSKVCTALYWLGLLIALSDSFCHPGGMVWEWGACGGDYIEQPTWLFNPSPPVCRTNLLVLWRIREN